VILNLNANGSAVPGAIQLAATVSDDSTPDKLTYQWSFTPNLNTPAATFADAGQDNPEVFQGYTVAHQGTIKLAVTDENGGTTTLNYQLTPNEFADAIDHGPVNALRRIVAGDNHTCVLTSQNTVRCWGDNQFGQLGYGNTQNIGDATSRLPFTAGDVPLPPLDPVVEITAGYNHTCALLQSGLVVCWGANQFGQLGYGNTSNLGDGEPVTSAGYVTLGGLATHIVAGGDHTCALMKTSGTLRCWGLNSSGELGRGNTAAIGDNETVASASDVPLGTGLVVKDMALAGGTTCVILSNGAIRCWGANANGQLGIGGSAAIGDNETISTLANISITGTVRKIAAGDGFTCALMDASTVRCWGADGVGQLGQVLPFVSGFANPNWGDVASETPLNLPGGDVNVGAPVNDLVAGRNHACALSTDSNSSGQLGTGNTNNGRVPAAPVNLDGITPYAMAAGSGHTCALRANGTARCWGANGSGQLGRGTTANASTATGAVDVQIFAPGTP
jgi:alpha-tubulin suppressor-like RCC1 family protein